MAKKISFDLIVLILLIFSIFLSLYYTSIGYSFQLHTIGILTDAQVFIQSNKHGSAYFRAEIFSYNITKGHKTSCTLVRPSGSYMYGSAEDAVKNTILGTSRDLWIASYNIHTCSDKSLKDFNQTMGMIFITSTVIFFICFAIMYYDNRTCFNISRTNWNNSTFEVIV